MTARPPLRHRARRWHTRCAAASALHACRLPARRPLAREAWSASSTRTPPRPPRPRPAAQQHASCLQFLACCLVGWRRLARASASWPNAAPPRIGGRSHCPRRCARSEPRRRARHPRLRTCRGCDRFCRGPRPRPALARCSQAVLRRTGCTARCGAAFPPQRSRLLRAAVRSCRRRAVQRVRQAAGVCVLWRCATRLGTLNLMPHARCRRRLMAPRSPHGTRSRRRG